MEIQGIQQKTLALPQAIYLGGYVGTYELTEDGYTGTQVRVELRNDGLYAVLPTLDPSLPPLAEVKLDFEGVETLPEPGIPEMKKVLFSNGFSFYVDTVNNTVHSIQFPNGLVAYKI